MRSLSKTPVILFGDFIAAYGVLRALGPLGIPVYLVSAESRQNICRYSRYVKDDFVLSHSDEHYFEKLLSWGLNTVGKEAVLIIAGADEPLNNLPKYLPDFPTGWRATFPDAPTVRMVREKALTYKIAQEHAVPVPRTFAVDSQDALTQVLSSKEIRFPVLMKSEKSSLMLKTYKTKGVNAYNSDQIQTLYNIHQGFFGKLLLQEMIPGGEEQLFCLKTVCGSAGKPLAYFMDKKIRSSARFSSCTLTMAVWDDTVFQLGRTLLQAIGYVGYASIEFKKDERDSLYKLMEINGRVSMNNSHALRCGINLPLAMYNDALGLPSPETSNDPNALAEKKILWWFPLGELGLIALSIREKNFSLSDYIRELKGDGYIVEPFFWRDPLPGIYSVLRTLGGSVKRGFKLIGGKLFSRKKST